MISKRVVTGALLAMVCATAALAADRPGPASPPEAGGGALAVVRTVAFLPFKGVVCVVGALVSFPVYWLSGLNPQVKDDTAAVRAHYCSRGYLLSPEWTK